MADLDAILGAVVAANASDLYLLEGAPVTLRVDGVATPLEGSSTLTAVDLQQLLVRLVSEAQRKAFESTGQANLSYVHPAHGRFRVSCYRTMGSVGIVLRRVKTEIPTLEAFDLLFSDVVMPGSMDGIGLARRVRELRPALPILLASGYVLAPERLQGLSISVLAKPYTQEELRKALGRLLASR